MGNGSYGATRGREIGEVKKDCGEGEMGRREKEKEVGIGVGNGREWDRRKGMEGDGIGPP